MFFRNHLSLVVVSVLNFVSVSFFVLWRLTEGNLQDKMILYICFNAHI